MSRPLKAIEGIDNLPANHAALRRLLPGSPGKRDSSVPKINLPATPLLLPSFDCEQGVLPLQAAPTPAPVTSSEDPLTPRLLAALGMLDANLDEVEVVEKSARQAAAVTAAAAAEEEEEPAWLRRASVDIAAASPLPMSCSDVTLGVQMQVVASTLTSELKREEAKVAALETAAHHLRSSAEAQARTTAEVLNQLDLTRSAAKGTQEAARRIVEDHEKDIALLLGELRMLAPPDAVEQIEGQLSAPLEALAARKRHAAAAASAKSGQSRTSTRGSVPRSLSFDRFSKAAAEAVSEVVEKARASSPFRGRR